MHGSGVRVKITQSPQVVVRMSQTSLISCVIVENRVVHVYNVSVSQKICVDFHKK